MTKLRAPPIALLDRYQGDGFQPLYTTTVRVSGGEAEHARASGVARSDDGNLRVDLRLPAELGGGGGGTNPEQLFAAAYAACFHGALSLLATRANIPIPGASVTVSVAFGRDPDDGLFMVTADVAIDLPGVDREIAEELVRNTERVCPYAKMARQGISSVVALAG
ncbi:Ohr family peroxiredoxin [Nannocystis sp. SCPEA4]|uniref:Ohr family peroxiredoxin n=1 Tax=Nannocystis sp. SCPEA4 TaxID=2996787 RepID=UPI002271FDE0|nr:Ohr family peroxiredoxin [Nannocystis sp. SCPEA4]MCY1054928.1 Ohr family peroxiredoxin [Nannocystis sp. SCPEA4]